MREDLGRGHGGIEADGGGRAIVLRTVGTENGGVSFQEPSALSIPFSYQTVLQTETKVIMITRQDTLFLIEKKFPRL